MTELIADRAGEKLGSRRVRDLLSKDRPELRAVNHNDTIIEVAAIMAGCAARWWGSCERAS